MSAQMAPIVSTKTKRGGVNKPKYSSTWQTRRAVDTSNQAPMEEIFLDDLEADDQGFQDLGLGESLLQGVWPADQPVNAQ